MSLDPLSNVVSALERAKIIPDVIPSTASFASPGAPTLLFSVVYPTSTGKEVLLGNDFTTEETQEEPVVSFAPMTMSVGLAENEGSEEVGYTLCMLDPDVPTAANPEFRSFRHWVITGLKSPADSASATSSAAALKTQAAVTPYRPPGPRPNSGTHRYTFLLFQEPSSSPVKIEEGAPEYGSALEERRSWDVMQFAEKYGLKLVGANFLTLKAVEQ